MTSYQVTESEIIDVLLGQAAAQVEEQVRHAVRSSKEFAATYDYWARIVPAMKQENVRAEGVIWRACQKLMVRLREDGKPSKTLPRGRKSRATFRRMDVAAATACLVLCAGFLVTLAHRSDQSLTKNASPPSRAGTTPTLERAMLYVDFSYNRNGRGTLSQPFTSLTEAIGAVSDGGTVVIRGDATIISMPERLRIIKPVRLKAAGGRIRVGDSEA